MSKAYIQLHVAIFLWGFTGILGRLITLQEFPLVWWRILITVTVLGVFLKVRGQLEPPPWHEVRKIAGVGALIAMHWVTFYGSIKYSNVSVALSCMASTALFTAIIEPLVHRRRPVPLELLLGLFTVLGIYLIFQFQQLYAVGIGMGLVSAFLSASFTIMNKSLLQHHGPRNLMFYELLAGLVVLTAAAPVYLYLFPVPVLIPDLADSGWLLILSVVCTVYAMQLSYQALQHVSAFVMNLSINLEPIYSIILAIIIFQENRELNAGFYIGSGIIIGSVLLNGLVSFGRKWRHRRRSIPVS
ncbi:MAG: DMT family transporter [Flavobacteriales bacterium]|nr:DMT family transporter [Flavobacteriales bacterium]